MTKKECQICANYWIKYPKKHPYRLAQNIEQMSSLYKCDACGAFWITDLRTARIVDPEEAKKIFPVYFSKKR